ncbi:MAG: ATP-binding protein, partial [Planctomycetes bacterium]|nr:ATP-binding protein [Planctomycetota bacterium]
MAHVIHHFRPHLSEPEALEAISVARETLLQDILARLGAWQPGASRQHYLLIGPRGIGKTHILRLIEHRVRSSRELAQKWYPVCFPEEQYTLTSLADLVLETLHRLGDATGDSGLRAAHARLRFDPNHQRVTDLSLDALRQFCVRAQCGILLMVENLNRLLEQQIKSREQIESLRKALIEEEWPLLIATSPTFLDAVTEPEEPLFEFFQVKFLQELSPTDVELLLRKRATLENDADFLEYLRRYYSRL